MRRFQTLASIALAALVTHAVAAQESRRLEYSWLTDGRISGQQSVTYSENGTSVDVHFQYMDRGRGPDFDSSFDLGADGMPVSFSASGVNNTRAKISEVFTRENDVGSWRSSVEHGERTGVDGAFYLPINDSPEIIATLARALLADPDQRVDLLPDGEASIDALTTTTLTQGDESRDVTLYRIRGIDLEPRYLWLDASGDLFGFTRKLFAVLPKGWESALPEIKAREDIAKATHYRGLTRALTQTLAGLTAIRGARVFDSVNATLSDPSTVFVWNGVISAIYEGETDIPADARVIDARNHTLLPSLWDMHNHVSEVHLLNYLAFGVINVRDMGNNHERLQKTMQNIGAGLLAGPDIYPMGFIDRRGAYAAPVGRLADDLDEALAHVDFFARRGYRGIKIYSAIEPEWIAPMAAAARQRSLPVAGHIPAFVSARAAIDAGFNEITHVNQLLLAFLGGGELDTRGPDRFLVPGVQTGDLDLDSPEVSSFLAFMREREVAHDTTLAVIMEMFRNRPGELSPIFEEIADHMPVTVRRQLIMTEGYNQGHEAEFARSADVVLELMAKLHDQGIPLLPGTDNYLPGMTLVRELIYYAEAGIPIPEVLQLGTIVPARHMGVAERIGSIEVGKEAQMFLVAGNPLEDIRALYRVAQVFKGARMYDAPELLRAQGIRSFAAAPAAPAAEP
jgi:hypothetical protein